MISLEFIFHVLIRKNANSPIVISTRTKLYAHSIPIERINYIPKSIQRDINF